MEIWKDVLHGKPDTFICAACQKSKSKEGRVKRGASWRCAQCASFIRATSKARAAETALLIHRIDAEKKQAGVSSSGAVRATSRGTSDGDPHPRS